MTIKRTLIYGIKVEYYKNLGIYYKYYCKSAKLSTNATSKTPLPDPVHVSLMTRQSTQYPPHDEVIIQMMHIFVHL